VAHDAANRFDAETPGTRGDGLSETMSLSAAAADSLLAVVWRGRWVMLVCVLVSLVASAVYIQMVTPIYTSTARLYLDYAGIRLSSSYESGGRPQTDKYLYTQAEVIKSRPILASAIEALTAQRLRTFANVDIPNAYLERNMVVDVGKKDETVSISVRSAYPAEAAQIVNCIVDTYMTSRSEHGQKNSAQVLRLLQEDLQRYRKELAEKRSQLMDFRTRHKQLALGSDQGASIMQRHLQVVQDAYTEAKTRAMKAEELRKRIQTLAGDPSALRQYLRTRDDITTYASADQERTSLEARAADLDLQKEGLLETFTADHPSVIELATEAERVEARLNALDDRFVQAATAAAEQQYVETKSYEEQCARLYGEEEEQIVKLSAETAQYDLLRLDVDDLTTYCQTREQKVREISNIVDEDVGQLKMAILEPAVAAEKPSEPRKARTMGVALVLGLILGGGITLFRDWLDQTLRSTDEISALLHLQILGTVPRMSRHQPMQERGRKVFLQPESNEAEAFRTIRTAVFFRAPKDRAKTVLITSPGAGEGKSTIVSNLAIAMACAGQKTLIVDADFRRPTQHLIFEVDHEKRCLSNVFAGKTQLAEAIQPTGVKNLRILTCGPAIASPAEVLNSQQFAHLLQRLGQVYDRILIDTPPVMAVTDAQIVGTLCDASVLVLRADRSTRKAAERARDALRNVGAHLLGVVFNEVHETGDRYGYYYQYRRHSGSDGDDRRRDRTKDGIEAHPRSRKAVH